MDEEKAKAVIKKLLLEGIESENKEKLQGVVYLAELETYRRHGKRLTGAPFYRRERGPHSPEIARIIAECSQEDSSETPPEGEKLSPLGSEELSLLDALSEGLGHPSTGEVLQEAKSTNPYLSAKEEDQVEFSTILTYADREKALRELFNRKGWKSAGVFEACEELVGFPNAGF